MSQQVPQTAAEMSGTEALGADLDALAQQRAALLIQAEEAQAAAASLERELEERKAQLEEVERRVLLIRGELDACDQLMAETQEKLRAAQRQEALDRREEAARRLADLISTVLDELEAYETADQTASRLARPGGLPQPEVLGDSWERLKQAVQERTDTQLDDELIEAAIQSRMPDAINALPPHLREAARARVQARKRTRQESQS
jgi:hypothetical protein